MSIITKIFGDPNEKTVKTLAPIIREINKLEDKYRAMSDEGLKDETTRLKKACPVDRDNEDKSVEKYLESILPEAFAIVREMSRRVLGQRHYDVQLIGGIILHRGQIAEMRTGEGKTLVATLPLYLNALTGQGAHLITVNDYLSQVGAGWMAPIYHRLGLSTGVIIHDTALTYDPDYTNDSQFDERLKNFRPVRRREAYACDITYGTNNEFGFDYLRDNMVPALKDTVQRKLNYAIVDEVDSILIDEARTPLIISAPAEESTDKYMKFAQLVERLTENEDYNVDEKMRASTLTEAGIAKMEKWLGVDNIYTSGGVREVHHIEQALKARVLFKRDKDYVVKDGEVIIVDEFTGRMMYGRRYSEGLHQAIEAKEGVKVQRESETLATITFQNYFRIYRKLSGMTGTAITEAEEFFKIYNLDTTVIPTNKPMIRADRNDLIYRTEDGKYQAVIADIKERNKSGQPVLVGTISIEKNEMLAELMEREGLHPQMLNAKNHLKEAQIISDAGKVGAITLATNMAGRGVDIMLGGAEPKCPKLPDGTIDQSDERYKAWKDWKDEHDKVLALGGLYVIGTERHEARRIDNQLRGRAGRQGDPGESRFFVSTEDDLMRIFGGDRMKNLMTTLRLPEDMPIENKLISKSIESAQRKVEGNNFDIRKHLVEYDDVINKHREAIYRRRREILELAESENNNGNQESGIRNQESGTGEQGSGISDQESGSHEEKSSPNSPQGDYSQFQIPNSKPQLSTIIRNMIEQEIETVVSFHTAGDDFNSWNLDEIYQVASTIFPVEEKLKTDLTSFTQEGNRLDKVKARTVIIEHLVKLADQNYEKMKASAKQFDISWPSVEKSILLRSIDSLWVEHLEAMSSMRQGIGLRGYGQRDPLIEYKKEAYRMFNELNAYIQKEVVYSVYKVGDVAQAMGPSLIDRARNFSAPAKEMPNGGSTLARLAGGNQGGSQNSFTPKQKPKDAEGQKIGRNDDCPCGSGKKYKKCCGK
jgi:preprotein translocase subunit SecA